VDGSFLAVVAIGLALVSAMIALRLVASGASRGRVALSLAELWTVAAIWVGFLSWLSGAMGTPAGGGDVGELRELPERFARLSLEARMGAGIGLVTCLLLIAHLMRSLGRLMGGTLKV